MTLCKHNKSQAMIHPFPHLIPTSIYLTNLFQIKDIQGTKSCLYHVTLLLNILKSHVTVSLESRYRLSVQKFTCSFYVEKLCPKNNSLAGIILCDLYQLYNPNSYKNYTWLLQNCPWFFPPLGQEKQPP